MRSKFIIKALFISLCAAILSGCDNSPVSQDTLVGYVNSGDPALGIPETYAGSQVCKECHFAKYESWRGTLHNLSLRNPDQRGLAGKGIVADSDENGIVDFKENLNLSVSDKSEDFHKFGGNAPILGYNTSSGKYTITIGAVAYNVDRTYGGNGLFSQIFLTKIGNCYYVLPVQYNETIRTYSAFKTTNWYNTSNQPIYDANETPVAIGRTHDSFERMCSGCHHTGTFMQYDDNAKEYLTGYVELNTGCEACHNAGAEHKKAGGGKGVGGIFNPKSFLDATVDGLKKANELCGRCHARGESVAKIGGESSTHALEFPAKVDDNGDIQLFVLGDILSDYLVATIDPANYWNYKSNGDFIASRSNYQQLLDINAGAHSPDSGANPAELPACFTCHDPHGTGKTADIVDTITIEGLTINVSVENNTLCLACHAGKGIFANIKKEDVANIIDAFSYEIIKTEVSKHTKHPYSPEEFKASRCAQCHLTKTGKSAKEYDITSHTFKVISPHFTREMAFYGEEPIPNPCEECHKDTTDYGAEKYDTLISYTQETASIPASHEQNESWKKTYHKLYTALKGDAECQSCHQRNNETIMIQANPGCTTYCHGI